MAQIDRHQFDPQTWLAWAWQCGYRVYLQESPLSREWVIVAEAVTGVDDADETRLWEALRPDERQAELNERALFRYLRHLGQFEPAPATPAHIH